MHFFCFFIYICLGILYVGNMFPLRTCNYGYKKLLFIFDCQGDYDGQERIAVDIETYFNTKTNTISGANTHYIIMYNGKYLYQADFRELECNESTPISNVATMSRKWQETPDMFSMDWFTKYMYLSIVFLQNITDTQSIQEDISKTVEEEQHFGIYVSRFFIIQTSENHSVDFSYHVTSFKDLNVEDIMLKICDMSQYNDSFSYSNNQYWTSTYFIASHLSEMSHSEALRYCSEDYGSDLPSLETSDEALYIFQFVMNLSFLLDTDNVILYLGLEIGDRKRGLFWISKNFFWHYNNFQNSKLENCFYINLTSNAKDFQLPENIYNFAQSIESINCDKKLPNSLAVCEYNNFLRTNEPINRERIVNNLENSKINSYAIDENYFKEFMNMVFSIVKSFDINRWELKRKQWSEICFDSLCSRYVKTCIVDDKYPDGALESYMCNDDFLDKINSGTNADKSESIVVAYNKNTPFYTLNTVDISQCNNYNECQKTVGKDTVNVNSNAHLNIYCLDDHEDQISNVTCSAQELKFNFSMEYFPCETDSNHYFYKCIKDINGQCQDNSNLRNCENVNCPEPFVKCPNSYCIFPPLDDFNQIDCPFAEANMADQLSSIDYYLRYYFILKDICIDSATFDTFSQPSNQSDFMCDNTCPKNYKCVSSKTARQYNNTTQYNVTLQFYHSDGLRRVRLRHLKPRLDYFPFYKLISVVEIDGRIKPDYKIDDDILLSHIWKLTELLVLDLSKTNLSKSDKLWSLDHFTKLKKLNLSFNEGFELDENFTFPSSLEVIDLYGTKVHGLRTDAFKTLIHLRYLNLSYTFIKRFKNMGIPDYFSLNTLHLEGLQIQNIGIDLFRGLTIHSELWASDFAICCPQVLNTNISVDKCHAPVNVISSCEHLVGETLKRIVIWIVGLLTIIGNGIVIAYRLGRNREIFKKAYGHFITSLTVSDFNMGMYLVLIACVDIYYSDVYVLEDVLWRNSNLCRFAGFLSFLSCETSTFFICLITLDRFLSITCPFGEHRYSKTGRIISTATVWILGLVLALLPVFFSDWEIYSSNGLCLALPFSSKQNKNWMFSFVAFVILKFVLFLLITFGQLAIFLKLIQLRKDIRGSSKRRFKDWSLATKLASVALTNFCCWFPVGILGFYSSLGYIFDREVYVWIAVLILPINSALNPIVYTIPALLSKCKK